MDSNNNTQDNTINYNIVANELFDEFERDFHYFKELEPYIVRVIQQEVDDQCDKLEFVGSCMFDEIPDKIHLDTIVTTIYNKVKNLDKDNPELQAEEISFNPLTAKELRRCTGFSCLPPAPMGDYTGYGRPNWLKDLIAVMLFNEVLYRRRRYRLYQNYK